MYYDCLLIKFSIFYMLQIQICRQRCNRGHEYIKPGQIQEPPHYCQG